MEYPRVTRRYDLAGCEKGHAPAESVPQALKRRPIFSDLAARVNSGPSRTGLTRSFSAASYAFSSTFSRGRAKM